MIKDQIKFIGIYAIKSKTIFLVCHAPNKITLKSQKGEELYVAFYDFLFLEHMSHTPNFYTMQVFQFSL